MGKGGVFGKVALVLGFLAFQLHMLTMPFGQYFILDVEVGNDNGNDKGECDDPKAADDAVKAFIIVTFIVLISCCILLLLMNFSGMGDSKIILFITMGGLILAAICGVIGVVVFESCTPKPEQDDSLSKTPFTTTTYISAAGFALLSAIFLLVEMCCG